MYQRARNVIEGVLSQCTHKTLRQAQDYVDEFVSLYITENGICGAVEGRFGIYSLSFGLEPEEFYMKCDCPSVHSMCKHVVALGLAYLANPDSFTDIYNYREAMMEQDREKLIRLICSLFVKYPETYKIFEMIYKDLELRSKLDNKPYQDQGVGI